MSSAKIPTPRCVFVRHGQTEWSKSGQHTSRTDIDLTPFGVRQMEATGKSLIGDSPYNLIQPENLTHIFISPRTRAQHTTELLLKEVDPTRLQHIQKITTELIREWEYGDYEGKLTKEIRQSRKDRGVDPPDHDWEIWEDGCENGESYQQVTERVDEIIRQIKVIHKKAFEEKKASDIIVVGHGHILRCFAARWVKKPINCNPQLLLDAGGVGVLSYQHQNVEEPALFLAGAFVVPVEEKGNYI
ncbi:unnamed protein product [Kuraishia capsulata CBS 1993]|uniref:Sedoheptulose 1,7-bisphosphatase n=1 Tax=Kuraishia capsulata CBS 1993 TaxID=1382522 RepID=W6MG85_9ASCO|nr:uncharacterized protein KUCA_T00000986001 [Kuraishia capsulata CBS 1993]CDK25019.1 unnamed protein product [Kuraishia capsulata CBS 1993]